MNRTFTENSKLIRDTVKLEDYLSFNNIKKVGKRYICPFCGGPHLSIYKASNNIERVQCFSNGCIHGDIIDLNAKLKNINDIESLNDLISTYNIKRFMPQNLNKPVEEEILFKKSALEHLSLINNELDKIFFFDTSLLVELNILEICHGLRQKLDEKISDLKYNKYSKEELRNLYKDAKNIINTVERKR